jgi:hypothetical protein
MSLTDRSNVLRYGDFSDSKYPPSNNIHGQKDVERKVAPGMRSENLERHEALTVPTRGWEDLNSQGIGMDLKHRRDLKSEGKSFKDALFRRDEILDPKMEGLGIEDHPLVGLRNAAAYHRNDDFVQQPRNTLTGNFRQAALVAEGLVNDTITRKDNPLPGLTLPRNQGTQLLRQRSQRQNGDVPLPAPLPKGGNSQQQQPEQQHPVHGHTNSIPIHQPFASRVLNSIHGTNGLLSDIGSGQSATAWNPIGGDSSSALKIPSRNSSKVGSPLGSSPLTFSAFFAKQREKKKEQKNGATQGSGIGHVGLPLRETVLPLSSLLSLPIDTDAFSDDEGYLSVDEGDRKAADPTTDHNVMFITHTISEDRTGNQEGVTRKRLAALGARCVLRTSRPEAEELLDTPKPKRPVDIQLTGQKILEIPIIAQLTEAEKNRQARNPEASSGNHNSIPFHRLYVGNIHFSITESDLQNVFEPFGELEFVQLQKEEMGRSRGYGFVQ